MRFSLGMMIFYKLVADVWTLAGCDFVAYVWKLAGCDFVATHFYECCNLIL